MNFLVAALGMFPAPVWLVLGGGLLVLLGAVVYIVGRAVLGTSDKPARRLTQLLLASRNRSTMADPTHADDITP